MKAVAESILGDGLFWRTKAVVFPCSPSSQTLGCVFNNQVHGVDGAI